MKTLPFLLSIFLLFATNFAVQAQAQSEEYVYFDAKWQRSTSSNYAYYRIIKYDNYKNIISIKDYYKSGRLQWWGGVTKGYEYSGGAEGLNGYCIWYYENGNKLSEGNYVNGEKEGLHKMYYENGMLAKQDNFANISPQSSQIITQSDNNTVFYKDGVIKLIILAPNGEKVTNKGFGKYVSVSKDVFFKSYDILFEDENGSLKRFKLTYLHDVPKKENPSIKVEDTNGVLYNLIDELQEKGTLTFFYFDSDNFMVTLIIKGLTR